MVIAGFGFGTGSTKGVDVLGPFSLLTVIGKEWRPLYQPETPVVPWHADYSRSHIPFDTLLFRYIMLCLICNTEKGGILIVPHCPRLAGWYDNASTFCFQVYPGLREHGVQEGSTLNVLSWCLHASKTNKSISLLNENAT